MESSTDTTTAKPAESASDGKSARGNGTTGTRRKLSDQQEAEVTRLYAATDTPVSEISKRFGIGESSVYRVAQRHGAALRGRTAPPATPKPRAARAAPAKATPRATGTRGRGAAKAAASAAPRAAAPASGNGRRKGGPRGRPAAAPAATPAARATPAKRTPRAAATRAAANTGGRQSYRVSYVASRVFVASDMNDAIKQAEAAGATDITGIVRG